MSKLATLSEATATGDEILTIVCAIEPALADVPVAHSIMACLSIAAVLINPEASATDVRECIRATSEYICLFMDARGVQVVSPSTASKMPN